jgi:hypothetical protein
VNVDHAIIAKTIKEGVNSPIRSLVERQLAKKKLIVRHIIIFLFLFFLKILSKNMMSNKKIFCKNMVFDYEKSFNALVVC